MYLSRKREIVNLVITYTILLLLYVYELVIIYKLFVIKQLGKKTTITNR